ncbi:MAG TPA: DUF1178 family protein [Sphingomonas sp.]
MIVFDLRCDAGHVFESWFGSTAAYEDQRARTLIRCPMCDSAAVEKAVMAPAIGAKGNTAPPPALIKAALHALATAQKEALKDSTWVGGSFATRARAMHDGTEPHATIHGQATVAEAKALVADGVPVAPLPLPVLPPEVAN